MADAGFEERGEGGGGGVGARGYYPQKIMIEGEKKLSLQSSLYKNRGDHKYTIVP